MAAITESTIVSDVVLDHPETLSVFESNGIDYCCGGGATIAAACAAKKGLDAARLVSELERAVAEAKGVAPVARDPRELSTAELIARIVVDHHAYVRTAAPELRRLMAKVAGVHGQHNPKLVGIARRLEVLLEIILEHLDQEEAVLFPALMSASAHRPDEAIERELASMVADHEEVGATLDEIRVLADDYSVPEWGCPTYRALFTKLKEFETDVHRHVHLENNVLMPRFVPRPAGARS